jgi:hypothetical protein
MQTQHQNLTVRSTGALTEKEQFVSHTAKDCRSGLIEAGWLGPLCRLDHSLAAYEIDAHNDAHYDDHENTHYDSGSK